MPDFLFRCSRNALCAAALLVFCLPPAGAWELRERPAEESEWGYRPANGAVADINPPPFTWRPEEDATGYELEVAADATFENILYAVRRTPWSAHCPDRVFAPGSYYWRYRAHNADNQPSVWSSVRRFTVPEGLIPFPMPNREALAARIPESHPRLFMTPDETTRLRALAEGPLADPWQTLVARANRLIEDPPDTSEPPKYPEGIEHKGDEWRRIWWGNRRRALAAADGAATLAFVYRLSGEAKYGEAARAILMAICDWDPKGSTNYRYNDEAAMPLLYLPSRAYTWAYDMFTEAERDRLAAMMRVRGEDCYTHLRSRRHLWRPYGSHANRAWHKLGEAATAFYDVIPEAPDWLEYIMTIFYTCYPVWGDADGGWHEGLAYWLSYLDRFMHWALVMQSPYGINVFEKPFFEHTGDFGLYTCPPGTQSGAFGDQAILRNSGQIARFMGMMAAVAGNPYWQWYAEVHDADAPGGYLGFLFAAQDHAVDARAPEDLPSSKLFQGTGLAVLNTNLLNGRDNIQVHFKSSPFGTRSHGYNANNAFLLNLGGERVLIRSGRRDIHGSPHHREWMWQTKSDNAILVNGEGQFPHTHQALGRITHFFTSERFDMVAGEAGESYGRLDRWARRLLFFKPDVLLIHDVLEASEASTFQWLLHAQQPFALGNNRAELTTEAGRIDIHFLHPDGLTLFQKDEFDTPPHDWASFTLDEWHLTAATHTPEPKQEFITLLRIDRADATAAIDREGDGTVLHLQLPDSRAEITLYADAFHVRHGEFDQRWNDSDPLH